MIRTKTIQSRLFVSYSLLILCIIIIFSSILYYFVSRMVASESSESLYQQSVYISNRIDTELEGMNSLSEKILFSKPLMDLFYSDIFDLNSASIYGQRSFNELIYSITGFQFPVSQIYMSRNYSKLAGIGDNNTFTNISVGDIAGISWYERVMALNGKKFISPPHRDNLNPTNKIVISLCRSFSSIWGHTPDSILEIQQNYNIFVNIINSALGTSDSSKPTLIKAFIFNSDGELIYPLNTTLADDREWKLYWKEIEIHENATFTIDNNINKETISFTRSEFSGWTVAVCVSESTLFAPVYILRNNIILASLFFLLITMVLSYFVSRGLTIPIKKIHKNIENLRLETLPTTRKPLLINSGINELEDLNSSFSDMCLRLKNSLEEVVLSKSHEMKAHMLALQSQMNPHFLYNSITAISIMAEDNGNINVVNTCADLAKMLRYISTDDMTPVTLNKEMEHTLNYLNLMKIRYREDLNFNIQISNDMYNLKLPKLIIQPIVENCMKYAINADPSWIISILGKLDSERWEISVRDNGPGFDEEWLKTNREKLDSINLYEDMPNLSLGGMGLINIYIRLKLMYGDNALFKLYNHPQGGAVVNLGGTAEFD